MAVADTLHHIFRVSCVVMLVCNISYISMKYMKYSTETNIGPVIPVFLETPRVSICYKTDFLLTNESVEDIIHWPRQMYINMTNRAVLQAVPIASSVIVWCKYRRPLKANVPWQSGSTDTCSQVFTMLRYRMQSYICYRFEYAKSQVYSYNEIVSSVYGRRELFQLKMIGHLSRANFVRPLIHFTPFPIDDTIFNQEIIAFSPDTSFRLSYDIYQLSSLPFPYETNCSSMSRLQCIRKCIALAMRSQSVAYDLQVNEEKPVHANLTIIASSELMEESNCGHMCISSACQQKLVNTHVDTFEDKNDADFIIETLDQPISKLQHVPSFTLIDYVTQAAGLIGIWLGLAFVSLFDVSRHSRAERTRHKLIELAFLLRQVTFTLHCHKFLKTQRSAVTRSPIETTAACKKRSLVKQRIRLVSESVFKAIVMFGLIWQLASIIINYMSYVTNSVFSYELNPIIEMPNLILCFHLGSLSGLGLLDSYDVNKYQKYYIDLSNRLNVSIDELLIKYNLEQGIDSCYFRNFSRSNEPLKNYDSSSCKSMVTTKTFYSSYRLCLMIKPALLKHRVTQSDIQNVPSNPGIAFVIRLNRDISIGYKFHIITDVGSLDIPYESLEYPATYSTYSGRKLAIVSYRLYRVNLLPRPYDSDCDEKQSKLMCLKKCFINSLEPYDRTPYPISTSGGKNQLLVYTDLMNEKMAAIWRRSELNCINQCTRSLCKYNFTITFLEQLVNVTKKINETIGVALASHPVTSLSRIAEVTFGETTYQILCSLSFWLGFALISLDPFHFHLDRVNNYLLDYVTEESTKVIESFASIGLKRDKTPGDKRKKKSLLNEQMKRLLIYTCACIGCTYQIVDSMRQYLNYPTSIDLTSQSESHNQYSLTVCLDTEELMQKYGESSSSSFNHSTDDWVTGVQDSLLSLLADDKQSLESCLGWGRADRQGKVYTLTDVSDRQLLRFRNHSVCLHLFTFEKVFLQNMPCYYMRPKEYSAWNRVEMQDTLDWQRTLFLIYFFPDILTRRFTLAIGEHDEYPESSSFMWSPNLFMRRAGRGIVLIVSYFKYTQHLLPAPYSDEGFTSIIFDKCLNFCINRRLKQPYSQVRDLWDRNNFYFISLLYSNDSFVRSYLERVRFECENTCFSHRSKLTADEPMQSFIIPTVSTSADIHAAPAAQPRGWLLLWLKSSDHPVYTVVFRPLIPLLDQIINIGSILNIWFGISVIHLTSLIARSTESNADTKATSLRREIDLIEEKLLLMQNEARSFPLTARHRREGSRRLKLMRYKLQ